MFLIEAEYRPDIIKESLILQKKHGKLSNALLQRKFKLSYTEASKVLAQIEERKE